MIDRRGAVLIVATAIVLVACSSGASPAGSGQPVGSASSSPAPAAAATCVVGASPEDPSGERWVMWGEPAIKKALNDAGAKYLATDAKLSAGSQATDVESLISRGAKVLIINAQNGKSIAPTVASAIKRGIPVIAYDRLIEDPQALYITFDNVEVGRMQARALVKAAPKGNYVFIKGDRADANADLLRAGQDEVLRATIKSGAVKNVGETYVDGWDQDLARTSMEQFLTASNNNVDAVLAENDGMAQGVLVALTAHDLAGKVALSGQDGDGLSLNLVALGKQTIDVWKDERMLGKAAGEAAVQLCAGTTVDKVRGASPFTTPGGNTLASILLKVVPVTKANLNVVLDADWTTSDVLCQGVAAGSVAACP